MLDPIARNPRIPTWDPPTVRGDLARGRVQACGVGSFRVAARSVFANRGRRPERIRAGGCGVAASGRRVDSPSRGPGAAPPGTRGATTRLAHTPTHDRPVLASHARRVR